MASKALTDIDALLPEDEEEIPTKPIKLFGRDWTLLCDVNSFGIASLASGDFNTLTPMMLGLVVESERAEFAATFSKQRNMKPERLIAIFQAMVEEASERPTKRPSASSRTAQTTRQPRKSAAGSSGRAVVRSVR
jgi:hypothetical protein